MVDCEDDDGDDDDDRLCVLRRETRDSALVHWCSPCGLSFPP
jgi:hypothetical protein